jgi:hypothetical protein
MFRMKHYAQTHPYRSTDVAESAVTLASMASGSTGATHTRDYAWEFGWSFDGSGWLSRREAQTEQLSPLDKALALAG